MGWMRQKSTNTAPDYTGLQLQTSVATLPVPVIWGQTKASTNVVWYANFQTQGGSGGKGGLFKSPSSTVTYSADLILALCEGPISGIGQIWRDQSVYTLAELGLSFFDGATPQTTWGYLAANYTSEALAYQGTAYVCAASYNLGSAATIGNHNFEIIGMRAGSGVNGVDADPALVIQDFLTNVQFGAGFSSANIDTATLLGASGDSSLQTYCKALGVAFSPALVSQEQGSSILARWLQILNCAAVWSGKQIKFIPYGDATIAAGATVATTVPIIVPTPVPPGSGPTPPPTVEVCGPSEFVADGGVTYAFTGAALTSVGSATPSAAGSYGISPAGTYLFAPGDEGAAVIIKYSYATGASYVPDMTPIYSLTDLDFVDEKTGDDPIKVGRVDPFTLPTIQRVECLSRDNQYNTVPVEARDQSQIELYGPRVGSIIQAHEVCDEINIGPIIAQTILQRLLYVRANFTFKLSWEYCLLEPMDIIEISDANLGLSNYPVRVVSIEEDDKGLLTFVCEELTVGVSTPVLYPNAAATSSPVNRGVAAAPVNPPLIYEPPPALSGGVAQLWLGASGGEGGVADPNWGGANVWLSLDGATYSQIGQIAQPLRQGALTSGLALASGWDTTDTLAISLAESGGVLSGTTAASAQLGSTLAIVDNELLAYESATLTGTSAYNLTGLQRGLYASAAAAHSSGALFARLDTALFKYTLPDNLIGQTVYLKFQSFNVFGSGLQDLSTCAAYSHALLGAGVQMPANITGFGGALSLNAQGSYTLAANWTADPNATSYQVEWSPDGSTWNGVYAGSATSFASPGFGYLATLYLRIKGISGAYSSPTWTQITLSQGPQQTVAVGNAGLYVGFDDLSVPLANSVVSNGLSALDDANTALIGNFLAAQQAAQSVQAAANGLSAQAAWSYSASVSATAALAESLATVAAQTAAGTASGQMQWIAQSSLDSGVSAAFELYVSISTPGGVSSYAGLRAEALSAGGSQLVLEASQVIIETSASKLPPFVANPDGTLTLQNVTKIADTIESLGVGTNGNPYMTLNFGSSPSIVIDDGT